MSVILLALKRMLGLPTATADQEGQLRYHRDGNVTGRLVLGQHVAGGTYRWVELVGGAAQLAGTTVADSDFSTTPPDGFLVVTTGNNRLWVRVSGTWRYVALT